MRSAPALKIWIRPDSSVAMLQMLAPPKISSRKAPIRKISLWLRDAAQPPGATRFSRASKLEPKRFFSIFPLHNSQLSIEKWPSQARRRPKAANERPRQLRKIKHTNKLICNNIIIFNKFRLNAKNLKSDCFYIGLQQSLRFTGGVQQQRKVTLNNVRNCFRLDTKTSCCAMIAQGNQSSRKAGGLPLATGKADA